MEKRNENEKYSNDTKPLGKVAFLLCLEIFDHFDFFFLRGQVSNLSPDLRNRRNDSRHGLRVGRCNEDKNATMSSQGLRCGELTFF